MKFVTQFNRGEWWQSADGRTWRRIFGDVARQLTEGLGKIEEAVAVLAEEGEDIITVQLQLINPKVRQKAPSGSVPNPRHTSPITMEEIATFYKFLKRSKRLTPEK